MASEQVDTNLTSYLKSMFVQYHGEEQHSPPPPAPVSPPVPATRGSKASLSEEVASMQTDLNNNEHDNNDDGHHRSSSPPSPAPPPPPITNGASTIKVDVIVHNDATNSVTNSELSHHKDIDSHAEDSLASEQHHSDNSVGGERSQPIVNGNRIALSFLDELKHTLQANKPLHDDEAPEEPDHKELQSKSKPEADILGEQKSTNGAQLHDEPLSSSKHSEVPEPTVAPLEAGHTSYTSSPHEDATSVNGEVSEVESGISIDDQSSVASESNNASLPNGHAGGAPEPATNSSANRLVLTRSASSDIANGSPGNSRRVIMRSVSQDVKFKLESIKEERKVTKTHVSSLASFWKDRMISPKEKK